MWIRPGTIGGSGGSCRASLRSRPTCSRKGPRERTSEQIANEVDSLGASLSASSRFGASYTSVNASGLINDAPQILDLMSDVVLHPAFPESELAKYKQREEADLEQRLSNPGFLAQQAFRRVLYGEAPLGVASADEGIDREGHCRRPEEISRRTLPRRAIPSWARPAISSREDMRALIEKYFGAWSGAAEPPVRPLPTPMRRGREDHAGGSPKFGADVHHWRRPSDPPHRSGVLRLTVMNQVEGGGPQARLFLDLREEHSYTYGAYSRSARKSIRATGRRAPRCARRSRATRWSDSSTNSRRIGNEPVPAERTRRRAPHHRRRIRAVARAAGATAERFPDRPVLRPARRITGTNIRTASPRWMQPAVQAAAKKYRGPGPHAMGLPSATASRYRTRWRSTDRSAWWT